MKKVLSLGDSISIGYRNSLKINLGDEYVVSNKEGEEEAAKNLNYPVGANCGDSRMLLSYVEDEYKNARLDYDIIVFNCGLHDIKYNWMEEKIQIEKEECEKNLKKIAEILKSTGAVLYFVNSTPVYDEIHNSTKNIILNGDIIRRPWDLEDYNKIAQKVMLTNGIPVIDLYSFTKAMGKGAVRDHVHYYEKNADEQGKYIADYIKARN